MTDELRDHVAEIMQKPMRRPMPPSGGGRFTGKAAMVIAYLSQRAGN